MVKKRGFIKQRLEQRELVCVSLMKIKQHMENIKTMREGLERSDWREAIAKQTYTK